MALAFVVTAAGAVTAETRAAMSHAGHEVPAAHDLTEHKGLNEGALTFFGTLMIGLASVAPAYSLAATLGYVVIEDGTLAPVAVTTRAAAAVVGRTKPAPKARGRRTREPETRWRPA